MHPRHVMHQTLHGAAFRTALFVDLTALTSVNADSLHFFAYFCDVFFVYLTVCHLLFQCLLGGCQRRKNGSHAVVLVNDGGGVARLCRRVAKSPAANFHVANCFYSMPSSSFPRSIPCLKRPGRIIACLRRRRVRRICYYLPSTHDRRVLPVVGCYRGRLVHFCDMPGVHGCLRHHVRFRVFNGVPMLAVHRRPLTRVRGHLLGETFSLFFSLIFLYAMFPFICVVVNATVGLSSPNPVFFGRGQDKRGKGRF